MTTTEPTNSELAAYLRGRLQWLDTCNAEIEKKISKGLEGLKDDADSGKIYKHYEYVLGNTFRYVLLVGMCSYVEEALNEIGKRLCRDYGAQIKCIKRATSFQKQLKVLSSSGAVDITPIESELDHFDQLITLRNCIVHCWGNVAAARNAAAVKAASKKVNGATLTPDEFLVLDDQVVADASNAAETIVDHILDSKLDVSIT